MAWPPMCRLMHRPAYESDAFAFAVGLAEVGLKLSSLALGLWPLALSQRLFSAVVVQDNTSSTKQAVGHRLHTAVKLMERLALKCGARRDCSSHGGKLSRWWLLTPSERNDWLIWLYAQDSVE